MKKVLFLFVAVFFLCCISMTASAYLITGGDATSQAVADDILDIVFAFDTSASMDDEISTVDASINSIVTNLDCPDCDVWVRARLMGITQNSLFGENVKSYVSGKGGTPVSNHSEDNGPAVTDLVNWYDWTDDSTASQDYYKAIVTIGDEGTENGYPADQADWDAAHVANQAAVANDIMIFSVVGTPWPSYTGNAAERDDIFRAMAVGGSGGGHLFDATGGTFTTTTTNTIETDLENIICTAGGGGTKVPEPATLVLFSMGLLGVAGFGRKKYREK
jgi:hypothetical protein